MLERTPQRAGVAVLRECEWAALQEKGNASSSDANHDQRLARGRWQQDIAQQVTDNMAWLMAAARNISPRGHEAEDLLSDAITRLFAAGAKDQPRIENVRTYLTTAMRNSAIDFVRSPRSRVDTHDDTYFSEIPQEGVAESTQIRSTELHNEFALVRQAFAELSREEQLLLDQVLVQGRKPGEVAPDAGLAASAVSVRVFRAKAALRRQLLVQHLRSGSEECADNSAKISGEVHLSLEEHSPRARGMKHVRACDHCKHNWRRFAHLSQALGVTTLLTLLLATQRGTGAAAAAVASEPASSGVAEPQGLGQSSLQPAGDASQPAAPATTAPAMAPAANAGTIAVPGITAAATGVATGATLPGSDAAASSLTVASAPAVVNASRIRRLLSSKAMLVAGVACLAGAAVSASSHFLVGDNIPLAQSSERGVLAESDQLDARMAAVASQSGQLADLDVSFDIRDADWWHLDELTVTIPDLAEVVSTPDDLVCEGGGQQLRCTSDADNWGGGVFTVRLDQSAIVPLAELAAEGEGSARQVIPPQQFTVTVSAESVRGIDIHGEVLTAL